MAAEGSESRREADQEPLAASVAVPADSSGKARRALAGRAELIDVHGPFTADELRLYRDKHLVDDEFLDDNAAGNSLYAWEFREARRYPSPARYDHPQGAVNLGEATAGRSGAVRLWAGSQRLVEQHRRVECDIGCSDVDGHLGAAAEAARSAKTPSLRS